MRALIKYFIEHPKMGNILMMLVFVFGGIALTSINSGTEPKIDPRLIQVSVIYPGASPVEVEESIILKIENDVQGIQGVRKINSTSYEDGGTVVIKIGEKYDTDRLLQKIKNAVDGISTFPAGMEKVLVNKVEFTHEAVSVVIKGNVSLTKLLNDARAVEDELLGLDGISKVELGGLPQPEIEIALDKEKMRAYQLSFSEVARKIQEGNIDLTGGTIRGESEYLMIRTKQKKYYANELGNIVVRNGNNGGIIYLEDIASVKEGWKEVPNSTFVNGERAVTLRVMNNEYEDVENTARIVKKYIEDYNSSDEHPTQLVLLYDNSEEVSSMKSILISNGFQGFLLVLLFLSLFLNRRLSFWVAMGIPISLFGMFIVAAFAGVSFNTVSLFGMIVVLGILVDDAVVVAESIYNHSLKGKSPVNAAIDGTMEVLSSVFSGVLTTIIAFVFFFYIEGVMGEFFVEMAVVIIGALAFSLFEGTFILPAHVAESKALRKGVTVSKFEKYFSDGFAKVRDNFFVPFLQTCLKNIALTIAAFVAVLIITFGALNAGIIRQGDAGRSEGNSFSIELEMPPGTPPEQTKAYLQRIVTSAVKIGHQYDQRREDTLKSLRYIVTSITSENVGSIRGILLPMEDRDYESQDFVTDIKEDVGDIPEAQKLNYVQQSHWGKPVSYEIISRNIQDLEDASLLLQKKLEDIDELKNVINNKKTGVREIEITLNEKGKALGLTLSSLMNYVRDAFYGNQAMRFSRGKEDVRIMVRYPQDQRASIHDLESMRILLDGDKEFLLSEIANFSYQRNLVEIAHYNGKRSISVEADVRDDEVNLNFVQRDIEEQILPLIKQQYPSISFVQSGQKGDQQITMDSVKRLGPIFLILLLVVILFTFRSKMQTFLVFILVPFSFIGVAWGHAIHAKSIDMVSYLGMVALMGVMVNNAIILIGTYNSNIKAGMLVEEALIEAARSRFRPIVLTTLTTVSGLFPLIFSNASVADIVTPMAVTVAYGLIVATFLSLLLLPIVLWVANRVRYYVVWVIHFEKPLSYESVEPANNEMGSNTKIEE